MLRLIKIQEKNRTTIIIDMVFEVTVVCVSKYGKIIKDRKRKEAYMFNLFRKVK